MKALELAPGPCGLPGRRWRGQRPDRGSRSGQCDCSHRAASPGCSQETSPPTNGSSYLCRVGRLQREELQDPRAALETFLQASTLRPDDPDVLHELVEIPHPQWPLVARRPGALRAGASVLLEKDKARYLVATANILNYELESPLEAVRTVQPGAGRESK